MDSVSVPSVSAFIGPGAQKWFMGFISLARILPLVGCSSKNLRDFPLPATGTFFSILFVGSSGCL